MLWTTEYLERLAMEAETEIAREVPCILDRLSLKISRGLAEYQLPDYVNNIRKITWLGLTLEPVGQIEYMHWIFTLDTVVGGTFEADAFTDAFEIGDSVIYGTPQGKPDKYFYSTFGENKILFHPNPNQDIAVNTGDLWNENLQSSVIVEFYRAPDFETFIIPNYIRRRTIKAYVLWKAFAKEGDGQNLNASEYWKNKYLLLLQRAKLIINRIDNTILKNRKPCQYERQTPARPVLPWNWQTIPAEFSNEEDC